MSYLKIHVIDLIKFSTLFLQTDLKLLFKMYVHGNSFHEKNEWNVIQNRMGVVQFKHYQLNLDGSGLLVI